MPRRALVRSSGAGRGRSSLCDAPPACCGGGRLLVRWLVACSSPSSSLDSLVLLLMKNIVKGNELTGQDNQVSLVRRAAWW
jgi:hypothetical protein